MDEIRITTIGDGAVGKTCMLHSYTKNEFPDEYVPTIFDNTITNVYIDDKVIRLNLWDTAGQEEYDNIRSLSYPNTDLFLICYSIDNPVSLKNIENKWYPDIRSAWGDKEEPIQCIVIGLKTDLRFDEERIQALKQKNQQMVTSEEGQHVAEAIQALGYVECSAKTREGLNEVFDFAVRKVLELKNPPVQSSGCCIVL